MFIIGFQKSALSDNAQNAPITFRYWPAFGQYVTILHDCCLTFLTYRYNAIFANYCAGSV